MPDFNGHVSDGRWSALRTFSLVIGQLGEPFPVSGHFQPERLVILPMRIGRHFAGLFGMPAVLFGCGHHTIIPAVIRIYTQKRRVGMQGSIMPGRFAGALVRHDIRGKRQAAGRPARGKPAWPTDRPTAGLSRPLVCVPSQARFLIIGSISRSTK